MRKMYMPCLLTLILLSGTALAADAPWRGVWSGSVGGGKVMVCLNGEDNSGYYYLRHLYGISFASKDKTGIRWTEMSGGQKSGEWKIELVSRNRLAGKWVAPNGKRSAAINLERVNASDKDLCDSEAYNNPRIGAAGIKNGKLERFEGKKFRTVAAGVEDGVSTIEILENGPHISSVNRDLRAKLRKDVLAHFQCLDYVNGDKKQKQAEYSVTNAPVFWTSRWLTVAESTEYYCGGPYPDHGYFYYTWDLETGRAVDFWTWFKGGKQEASASLNKLIIASPQENEECTEAIAGNNYYSLRPAKGGMIFYPLLPHVAASCQGDILIPYKKLLPFATETGKNEIKALLRNSL